MNYIIQLSNKTEIEIDEADFEKFTANSASGNLIRLKRGIVNPSFVVSIIPSSAKTYKREIEGYIDQYSGNYVVTKDTLEPYKLTDEFDEFSKEIKKLAKVKKLTN